MQRVKGSVALRWRLDH